MHLVAILVAVALLVAGYVFFFKSLSEQFQMQHEINAKLPKTDQFEPVFWWLGTWGRFHRLQEELLPDSPRPQRFRRFRLSGLALLISGLLLLALTLRK